MAKAAGYFEQWTNEIRHSHADSTLLEQLTRIIQREERGQVHRAGSQAKKTGLTGSDLDYCVMTNAQVTESRRRELARIVEREIGRPARVQWHVIRIAAGRVLPKADIAFANASFGDRALPDLADFKGQPKRQQAARALKAWARSHQFPWSKGWAMERFVVHLDSAARPQALDVALGVLDWLGNRANQSAVESVLRPHAEPEWSDEWSNRLPGRLQALSNEARRTLKRYQPDTWTSGADAGAWMTG